MELSKLQKEIVNATEPYIVVVASAAAGKTRVLTERVRKMLRDGTDPKNIAVITFTNLAAQELKERLAGDYKDGIYIGTIHSLANYMLLSHGIETKAYLDNDKFDLLFAAVKKNPQCIKHIRHILLDEAQDTSPEEYEFIFDMINPVTFFVAGDYNQSIYSFKGCDPELFNQLMEQPDVTVYNLNENYRNGNNILNFAKKILSESYAFDKSVAMRPGGTVWKGEATIENLKNWIQRQGEFKDWAVLCTTNGIIAEIREQLEELDIPSVSFRQGEVTKDQLEEMMNSNCVKVLTYWSAKGLEFPNVAAWKPKNWGGDETCRVNYVGATRAKDILLWMEEPHKKKKPVKQKSKWF